MVEERKGNQFKIPLGSTLTARGYQMKKEYVVNEISASPDGAPHVLVSLKDPKDMSPHRPMSQPMVFTNIEDIAKNMSRMFTQTLGGSVTVIKLGLHEYEELNIKVGDRIALEISKVDILRP